jgi:tetratricopeptide (TPR) repeat protein
MRINSLHDALAYFPDFDGYWRSDDLAMTEAKIQSLLPTNWASEWTTKTVELLTQLARAQALQGKFSEARSTLDQAHQMIFESQKKMDPVAELRWILEQGRVLSLSMSPSKAHDQFVHAWNLATEKGLTFFAIDAALMISTVRPPKFRNEWLKKALDMAESSKDENDRMWLAQLLFLEGWHAFDTHQFDLALERFTKALDQPMIRNDESKGFALQWSRSRTLRALNQIPEALEIQEMLLARMQQRGKVSGHVYLEIAECKQLLNLKEEAKPYFELAYTQLSEDLWYSDNKKDELDRMKYLFKKR